jgi:DNA polymerase-4/protein ImuB
LTKVLLPHFPWRCEVRRHPDIADFPVIVVQSKKAVGSQKLVFDHSPGLEDLPRSTPLQEALARHGDVKMLIADIPYYQSVFNEILDALEQKSPLVEGAELGCVYIGVDGLQLIYPDDDALIDAVRGAVEGFTPQMGIAANKFLASLAAQQSPPAEFKVLTGNVDAFLKKLPGDALPVSVKSRSKLRDFGLVTLGQVANLPPGPFQSQFGAEGKRIWELSRGCDDTPLYSRFMEETIEESATLPSVTVSLDAILVALESLLARLFAGTLKGRGIRRLTLWTQSWNAEHWERNINFNNPAMDVRSVIFRIKRVLENYPQPGPVEQVGLRITGLGYPRGRQKSLLSEIRTKDHLMDDIRQLELKLGNPQVYTVKEVEPWSRIPERRYALTPANR